jgi:hypothetical protein
VNPTRTLAGPLAAAVALLAGCGQTPHAPPLVAEPTYTNARLGLTLTPPAGWLMQSRAEPPPGPLREPVVLVAYLAPKSDRAMFELEVTNPLPDADVEKYLTDHQTGGEKWQLKERRAEVKSGGRPAVRVVFSHPGKKGEILREVTAVRRADLTCFFIATGYADQPGRDAMRRAVETAVWE